jgi:hypothetical protein
VDERTEGGQPFLGEDTWNRAVEEISFLLRLSLFSTECAAVVSAV